MTQSEFIERVNLVAGISFRNATLSSWENGQSSPTGDLIPVIAGILETSVSNLYVGNQPVEEPKNAPEAKEPPPEYRTPFNTSIYKRIFEETPDEAFYELLKEYENLLTANENLRAEHQKLEGKLAASSEFLAQLINMKKD